MLHVTLNTGQVLQQPLETIDKAAVQALRPLVLAGGGPLPAPHGAFLVQIKQVDGGGVFTVSRPEGPVVTCGVAWTKPGAAQVWPKVEAVYLDISDTLTGDRFNAEPRQPDQLPWMATVVHLAV